jgi:hypothetical protein
MTQTNPLARFQTDLAKRLAARDRLPDQHPLSISPWMAMSLLQKAIRRGRTDLAFQSAATLLRDAPERLWRRLGGIAFEDSGIGCLPVVGLTCAALHSKRLRADLGGDWAVASLVVQALCDANKSRSSDDLFMALETLPDLRQKKSELVTLTNPKLRLVALHDDSVNVRALAILFLLGTDRPGGKLPPRRGEPGLAFDVLDEMGVAPTTLAICREGYKKTGESLPPLVGLLALENGLRAGTTDDPMPDHVMIGGVPSWAVDMFTREGKEALSRLLLTNAGIAEFATAMLPSRQRLGFLGQVLFRVEGGQLARRVGGDLSDRLHAQLQFETLGIAPRHAVQALSLMRDDLPLLNRIRASVMGGEIQ